VPSQRFADVSGEAAFSKPAGVLVLNDSKYGHSLQGSTLAITLIRSSFEPDILPEIGEHDVRWRSCRPRGRHDPRGEDPPGRGVQPAAAGRRHRPARGQAPGGVRGLSAIGPASVVVSEVKKAESGDDLVIRLYETRGRSARRPWR